MLAETMRAGFGIKTELETKMANETTGGHRPKVGRGTPAGSAGSPPIEKPAKASGPFAALIAAMGLGAGRRAKPSQFSQPIEKEDGGEKRKRKTLQDRFDKEQPVPSNAERFAHLTPEARAKANAGPASWADEKAARDRARNETATFAHLATPDAKERIATWQQSAGHRTGPTSSAGLSSSPLSEE